MRNERFALAASGRARLALTELINQIVETNQYDLRMRSPCIAKLCIASQSRHAVDSQFITACE
jgi:hypothetical protein